MGVQMRISIQVRRYKNMIKTINYRQYYKIGNCQGFHMIKFEVASSLNQRRTLDNIL